MHPGIIYFTHTPSQTLQGRALTHSYNDTPFSGSTCNVMHNRTQKAWRGRAGLPLPNRLYEKKVCAWLFRWKNNTDCKLSLFFILHPTPLPLPLPPSTTLYHIPNSLRKIGSWKPSVTNTRDWPFSRQTPPFQLKWDPVTMQSLIRVTVSLFHLWAY